MLCNQPRSRKNCIATINGKITRDNRITAMNVIFTPYQIISPHPVKSAWDEAINPYWASADLQSQTWLMTRAAISAKAIRIPEIIHQLTPVRDATADSRN